MICNLRHIEATLTGDFKFFLIQENEKLFYCLVLRDSLLDVLILK